MKRQIDFNSQSTQNIKKNIEILNGLIKNIEIPNVHYNLLLAPQGALYAMASYYTSRSASRNPLFEILAQPTPQGHNSYPKSLHCNTFNATQGNLGQLTQCK